MGASSGSAERLGMALECWHSLFTAHHGHGRTKPFQGRTMPWQEGSTPGIFSWKISPGYKTGQCKAAQGKFALLLLPHNQPPPPVLQLP